MPCPEISSPIPQHGKPSITHVCDECGTKLSNSCPDFAFCPDCFRDRPLDPNICPYPPGSPEKVAWMVARVEAGLQPTAPFDPTCNGFTPRFPKIITPETDNDRPALQPRDDRFEIKAMPRLRVRGVGRHQDKFRARPECDGKKHMLGLFATYEEAAAVAKRWWVARLGLFWELGGKMWHYRRRGGRIRKLKGRPSGGKLSELVIRASCRRWLKIPRERKLAKGQGCLFC